MLEHNFNDVRQEITDLGMSVVEFQKKFNDISLELLKNTSTDNEFPTVKGINLATANNLIQEFLKIGGFSLND